MLKQRHFISWFYTLNNTLNNKERVSTNSNLIFQKFTFWRKNIFMLNTKYLYYNLQQILELTKKNSAGQILTTSTTQFSIFP